MNDRTSLFVFLIIPVLFYTNLTKAMDIKLEEETALSELIKIKNTQEFYVALASILNLKGESWCIENIRNKFSFQDFLDLEKDSFGRNAILIAAVYGNNEIIKFIFMLFPQNRRQLLFCKDNEGATPLHLAAYFGHIDSVNLILEQAKETRSRLLFRRDYDGASAFMRACSSSSAECENILDSFEDAAGQAYYNLKNLKDSFGHNAEIYYICKKYNIKLTKSLCPFSDEKTSRKKT